MLVLFASLAVLFGTSLVAFGITRAQNALWRGPGMPALPLALWLSTAAALLMSGALTGALRHVQHNRLVGSARALHLAWLFGAIFLGCQSLNWLSMSLGVRVHTTLYPFTFYFLTGLHAAHVLAGFVPLYRVTRRLGQGEYSSSRYEGFKFCVQYWHFLTGVWLILFAALELFS